VNKTTNLRLSDRGWLWSQLTFEIRNVSTEVCQCPKIVSQLWELCIKGTNFGTYLAKSKPQPVPIFYNSWNTVWLLTEQRAQQRTAQDSYSPPPLRTGRAPAGPSKTKNNSSEKKTNNGKTIVAVGAEATNNNFLSKLNSLWRKILHSNFTHLTVPTDRYSPGVMDNRAIWCQ